MKFDGAYEPLEGIEEDEIKRITRSSNATRGLVKLKHNFEIEAEQ